MRFEKILNEEWDKLNEEVPQVGAQDATEPTVTPQEHEAQQPAPQEQVVPMSPESEVMLIRLLKKALVVNVSDVNDVDTINEMGIINGRNAKDALAELTNIINKYSSVEDV